MVSIVESAVILCLHTQGMHLPRLTYPVFHLSFHLSFQVSSHVSSHLSSHVLSHHLSRLISSHVLSHLFSRPIFRVSFIPCVKYPVPYVRYLLSFMSRAQTVSKILRRLRSCLILCLDSKPRFAISHA